MANKVSVKVDVQNAEAIKKFKEIAKAGGHTFEEVSDAAQEMSQNIQQAMSFGAIGDIALSLGIGATFTEASKKAASFEKALNKATAIMNISESESKKLGMTLRELSQSQEGAGIKADEFAKAAYTSVSAYDKLGDSGQDLTEFLKQAAIATGAAAEGTENFSSIAEGALKIMNTYGKDLSDITNIFDVLFATIKFGTDAELSNLIPALQTVATSGNKVGFTMQESAAALAFLSKKLDGASGAAVPLARLFDQLQSRQKELNNVGVDIFDEGKIRPLIDIVKDLQKQFTGLTDEQKAAKFESMGFEINASKALSTLISGGQEAVRVMSQVNKTIDEGGITLEQNKKNTEDTATAMAILVNKGEEAVRTLGDYINKGLTPAAKATENLNTKTIAQGIAFNGLIAIAPLLIGSFFKLNSKMSDIIKTTGSFQNAFELNKMAMKNNFSQIRQLKVGFGSLGQTIGTASIAVAAFSISFNLTRAISEITGLDAQVQKLFENIQGLDFDKEINFIAGTEGIKQNIKDIENEINKIETEKEVNIKLKTEIATSTTGDVGEYNKVTQNIELQNAKIIELQQERVKLESLLERGLTKEKERERQKQIENNKKNVKTNIDLTEKEIDHLLKVRNISLTAAISGYEKIKKQAVVSLGAESEAARSLEEKIIQLRQTQQAEAEKAQKAEQTLAIQTMQLELQQNKIKLEDVRSYWRNRLTEVQTAIAQETDAIKSIELQTQAINIQTQIEQIGSQIIDRDMPKSEPIKQTFDISSEFTKELEAQKEFQQMSTESYIEYLNSLLEQKNLSNTEKAIVDQQLLDSEMQIYNQDLADKKAMQAELANFTINMVGGAFDTLIDNFGKGTDEMAKAFGAFAKNMLKDIAKMIIQMTILASLKKVLEGTTFGGFLGFSGGGEVQTAERGGEIKSFAKGGAPEGFTGNNIAKSGKGKGVIAEFHGGEYIAPKKAVDYYGIDFFEKLRKREIPKNSIQENSIIDILTPTVENTMQFLSKMPSFEMGGSLLKDVTSPVPKLTNSSLSNIVNNNTQQRQTTINNNSNKTYSPNVNMNIKTETPQDSRYWDNVYKQIEKAAYRQGRRA